DLFGVALVHLAAISLDEEFRHGGWKQYIVTPRALRAHYRLFIVLICAEIATRRNEDVPAIGVIGGSGLYQMEELRDTTEHKIDTPFGPPSDVLVGGKLGARQVYFLPRHGRGHRILPHEINHRANIYALRSLNVRWIVSVGAVGSLQEKYAPRD